FTVARICFLKDISLQDSSLRILPFYVPATAFQCQVAFTCITLLWTWRVPLMASGGSCLIAPRLPLGPDMPSRTGWSFQERFPTCSAIAKCSDWLHSFARFATPCPALRYLGPGTHAS